MAEDPEPTDDRFPEPDVANEPDRSAAPAGGPRSIVRHLDRRTVAICLVIGVVAALLAGLVASLVLDDDQPTDGMELQESRSIDSERVLAQPLEARDGTTTSLGDYFDGRPMLVNLWASNCESCITEMPLLEQARAANPDVDFVGVATQDHPDLAAKLAKQTKITYPWALDPTGELYYEARGTAMPTTIMINGDGKVVASETVKFHSLAEVQAFIDQAG